MKTFVTYQIETQDIKLLREGLCNHCKGCEEYAPGVNFKNCEQAPLCKVARSCRRWERELEERELSNVYKEYCELVEARKEVKRAKARAKKLAGNFYKKYGVNGDLL